MILVNLNKELETELRKVAGKRWGYKRGCIKWAIEEAVRDWLKTSRNVNLAG